MSEPEALRRFLDAQAPVYAAALGELKAGRKRSHWMWFVFPQLQGLGHSTLASFYGIATRAEAVAYLEHPVLGARLRECVTAVLAIEHKTALEIFGSPDDLKLRSSVTLFAQISSGGSAFQAVLDKFFDGVADSKTLQLLKAL